MAENPYLVDVTAAETAAEYAEHEAMNAYDGALQGAANFADGFKAIDRAMGAWEKVRSKANALLALSRTEPDAIAAKVVAPGIVATAGQAIQFLRAVHEELARIQLTHRPELGAPPAPGESSGLSLVTLALGGVLFYVITRFFL